MITVCNTRNGLISADIHVYCGRGKTPTGMVNAGMGNPFYMTKESERDRVCDQYADLLKGFSPDSKEGKIIARIAQRHNEGKHVALYCWCAPLRCHCDSIKMAALALAGEAQPVALSG